MSLFDSILFRVRRSNSPFWRAAKRTAAFAMTPTVPPLPRGFRPPLRALYELHFMVIVFTRSLLNVCYRIPLFQGRCASFGRGVRLDGLPYVNGPLELHLGDDVLIGGKVCFFSGAIFEKPRFVMKDHSEIGWQATVVCNREVIIEEYARVSYDCRISDSDGHPREADRRAAGLPPDKEDIKPVRISKYAWIGNGAHILKGVTIGEGAVVAANSVVITDIPAYSLAMGNPAEVFFRNYGKPAGERKQKPQANAVSSDGGVTAVHGEGGSGDPARRV